MKWSPQLPTSSLGDGILYISQSFYPNIILMTLLFTEIVERVMGKYRGVRDDTYPDMKNILCDGYIQQDPFRPDTTLLECQDFLINCMKDCWSEIPENRPDFRTVRSRLKNFRQGM